MQKKIRTETRFPCVLMFTISKAISNSTFVVFLQTFICHLVEASKISQKPTRSDFKICTYFLNLNGIGFLKIAAQMFSTLVIQKFLSSKSASQNDFWMIM